MARDLDAKPSHWTTQASSFLTVEIVPSTAGGRKVRRFVDTVARSREHAVSLKDRVYNYLTNKLGRMINPEYANFERILVQLPNHDRIVARTDEIVLRPVDNVTLASIEQLFLATNPEQLGVGRDTANYMRFGETYNQVKPIAAFDVDYSKSKVQRQWERSQANARDEDGLLHYCGQRLVVKRALRKRSCR